MIWCKIGIQNISEHFMVYPSTKLIITIFRKIAQTNCSDILIVPKADSFTFDISGDFEVSINKGKLRTFTVKKLKPSSSQSPSCIQCNYFCCYSVINLN